MKVLMLCNEDISRPSGGLGVHVREICRKLGADITVLCVDYMKQEGGLFLSDGINVREVKQEDWFPKKGEFRILKVFNTNEVLTKMPFLTKFISEDLFIETALRYIGKEEFDIVHMHDAHLYKVAKNLTALFKAKLVITCHLSFLLSHNVNAESPFYLYEVQIEGSAFRYCDKLITVSNWYAKALKNIYFLYNEAKVIYNGVNFDELQKIERDNELRKRFGNKKLVVFVGRLVPTKGIENIFDAIKSCQDCFFALISTVSPTAEEYYPLIRELKRMKKQGYDNFEWYNWMKDDRKWSIMKVADLAIMPSNHEPFGIAALEWMALGIPLIVSNANGLGEFCNDSNATIIKPNNSSSLINAINNHKLDKLKITNALMTAKSYNWGKMSEELLGVYEELIRR
jgi:glycosyltransferase involved in cell wall biosynthesis